MKKEHKEVNYYKSNRLKEPPTRQYSTLSTSQYPRQSNNPIFGLPPTLWDEYKEFPFVASQTQKIKPSEKQQPQVYGEFAINYQQNLRKTVLNHTKNLFKRRHKSFNEKVTLPSTIHLNNISQSTLANYEQRNKQVNETLNILQKVILKDVDYIQPDNRIVSIQANKLPMLIRKQLKKQRAKSFYLSKYKWQPGQYSVSYQNQNKQKRRQVGKKERAQICGWEDQQSPDF